MKSLISIATVYPFGTHGDNKIVNSVFGHQCGRGRMAFRRFAGRGKEQGVCFGLAPSFIDMSSECGRLKSGASLEIWSSGVGNRRAKK